MDYVVVSGVSKKVRSREPDMKGMDEDDPMYLEHPEKMEEDRKNAEIPFIERVLKAYPYHNADYTVWLDEEFGSTTPGFTMIKDLKKGKILDYILPILDQIPDLSHTVEMRGYGFTRQVGVTVSYKRAVELRKEICKHPTLETVIERNKVRTIKVKGEDKIVGNFEADKVRAFVKRVKEGKA